MNKPPKFALILPVLNEEVTLAKVIQDFRKEIKDLDVYVFDNGSTDRSAAIALEEKATLIHVPKKGKGNVVRRMFEVIEADYYIMVDSDDTYDSTGVWQLLEPVIQGKADMSVGSRLKNHSAKAFRKFHRFGNSLILNLINIIFRSSYNDILSGYRVMSRRYVKNIPLLRDGFEVETELTVYSLICGFSVLEIPLPYKDRPEGSYSKLKTFGDGYKVVLTIIWLARDLRPLLFFGMVSLLLLFAITLPLMVFVPESPFFYYFTGFASLFSFMTGLILNTLNVKFAEIQALFRRFPNGTQIKSDHNSETVRSKTAQLKTVNESL